MPRHLIAKPDLISGKLVALAEDIAAVLHNPLTPRLIREALADGLRETFDFAADERRLEIEQSPEYIALILASWTAGAVRGEEGGAR